jgi:hypothetical protein
MKAEIVALIIVGALCITLLLITGVSRQNYLDCLANQMEVAKALETAKYTHILPSCR